MNLLLGQIKSQSPCYHAIPTLPTTVDKTTNMKMKTFFFIIEILLFIIYVVEKYQKNHMRVRAAASLLIQFSMQTFIPTKMLDDELWFKKKFSLNLTLLSVSCQVPPCKCMVQLGWGWGGTNVLHLQCPHSAKILLLGITAAAAGRAPTEVFKEKIEKWKIVKLGSSTGPGQFIPS